MPKTGLRRGEGFIENAVNAAGITKFRARWYEGKRLRSQTFATYEAARDHLIDVSSTKRKHIHTPSTDLTVKQACEAYLERGRMRWSRNTYASYRQVAQSHVYPSLGSLKVAALSAQKVQSWIDYLSERKKLKPATVANAKIVIDGTCKELVRLGNLSAVPGTNVRLPSNKKAPKSVWSPEDISAILAVADGDIQMKAFYTVALTTAMRPGEIRALKWRDIDYKDQTIRCQRTITRDEHFRQVVGDTTKTDRARMIAVPQSTLNILKELRTNQLARRLAAEYWEETDLVFDRGNGHLLAQQSLRKRHQTVCALAGVTCIRFHDLRHTAATLMLKGGVHIKVASEILGHSSVAITLDTYSHIDVSLQRSATDMLAEIARKKG